MASLSDSARRFLTGQRVARLATADGSGAPHVVPVCFALVGSTLYVPIDEKPKTVAASRLRRLRNIAGNPRVALVADVYDDRDWTRLGFVLVRATARVLLGSDEEGAVSLAALRDKYAQYRQMALEERPLIAADITRVTMWGRLD